MDGKNRPRHRHLQIFLFCLTLLPSLMFLSGCGSGDGAEGDTAETEADQHAPIAQITASPDNGSAPLTVTFNASDSSDSDGDIITYAWEFGDGDTGSGATITHTYTDDGTYTAQLTVTDDNGFSDETTLQIVVEASAPQAQFNFNISTGSGSAPLTVTFDASDASDSDGEITTYAWEFGDGNTGSGVNVTHDYSDAGTYSVRLTVIDDDGLSDSSSQEITVQDSTSTTYSISGTVTSATYAISDSDVNDTNTTPVSNDSFDDAQAITAPVTVSGYVNVTSDPDDYFLVTLTQGAVITLLMTEKLQQADLNLYLYEADAKYTLYDASLALGNAVDSLVISEDGSYYIRVRAARHGSGYALSIGNSSAAAAQHPLRLSDSFVPGEVLVRFDDQAAADSITRLAGDAGQVSDMGLTDVVGASGHRRLLRRSDTVDKDTLFNNLGIDEAMDSSAGPGKMDDTQQAKLETLWMVRGLSDQTGVQYAEPNYIRQAFKVPDDPYYSYQWHYPLINLPSAWDITTGSSDVEVAVIDTGVLSAHPDLSGQFLEDGYDFISDTDISLDGDGVDDDPEDPGDQSNEDDSSSFHGTHVAGTIAAVSDNTDEDTGEASIGVAGIAWGARILPLRVLGYGGSGTSYDIIQAVRYAAGLSTDYDGVQRDHAVDVINLSLGGSSASQSEAEAYAEAREQGVIIIAAAGNNGSTAKMYPAAYDGVVSVSAVTIDEELASYSSYGETIDIAAPGGSSTDSNADGYVDGVLSTIGDDSSGTIEMGYAFAMGTSMAAPHVSGVVALMKAVYPDMTPNAFDTLLQAGSLTTDLGDSGWDEAFGWGLIDADKAVQIAYTSGDNDGISAILSVSPNSLSFASDETSAEVAVTNSGDEDEDNPLTVTDISHNADWLEVATKSVDINTGLGTYTFTIDRDGLDDGTYSTAVTFISNLNTAQVTVTMQVGTDDAASDGGYHYVLLLDADTGKTVAQVGTAGEDGIYAYQFKGLSYGDTYKIVAGTNPDGDIYICEDGEACGAYLSVDQPVTLTIDEDMENIDFTTDINLNLSTQSQSSQSGAFATPLYWGNEYQLVE